jgi:hypothetical protein
MTNTDVPTCPDVLALLLRVYTIDQLQRLATYSSAIAEEGFGKMAITFTNGHPRFLEIVQSREFPK